MQLNLLVLYGSVRTERMGIRAARFVTQQCQDRGHDTFLVDPQHFRLPLLDKMYKEYVPGTAPEILERLAVHIKNADAYIVVSGEYNHTIPPGLANLLDHFLEEYFYKPSGIVCYSAGSFGGVRAAIALHCDPFSLNSACPVFLRYFRSRGSKIRSTRTVRLSMPITRSEFKSFSTSSNGIRGLSSRHESKMSNRDEAIVRRGSLSHLVRRDRKARRRSYLAVAGR